MGETGQESKEQRVDGFAYLIKVPEGNGYDINTFKGRVVPHIEQLLQTKGVIVPPISDLKSLSDDMAEGQKPDERNFGMIIPAEGDQVMQLGGKLKLVTRVVESHYGLQIEPVRHSYDEEGKITFIPQQK